MAGKESGAMTVREAGLIGGDLRKRELGSEGYQKLGTKGGGVVSRRTGFGRIVEAELGATTTPEQLRRVLQAGKAAILGK
ncbi:MAG: hypothetical protein AAB360_01335 [Patescibacteria group bacterium]